MFPWKYFEADVSLYLDGHIEFGEDFFAFSLINLLKVIMILLLISIVLGAK